MIARLHRTPIAGCMSGVLVIKDEMFFTVERPWIPHPTSPGGMPLKSCIPNGKYRIEKFVRPNNDVVPVLINEALGVYARAEDRANDTERFACLMHAANFAHNVKGCIGPGVGAQFKNNSYSTTYSKKAMARIKHYLNNGLTHIEITGDIYENSDYDGRIRSINVDATFKF